MRILYFSRQYTVHDRRFLLKLSQTEHKIFFLRLHENSFEYEKNPPPPGIISQDKALSGKSIESPEECLSLMPDFEKVIGEFKPDIIHAGPVQTCAFMAALSGTSPFIAVSWGYDMLRDAGKNSLYKWATKFTLEKAAHFICDCEEVKKKAFETAAYPEAKITSFPWGIELADFSYPPVNFRIRKNLGWEDKFVIISTRSWEKIYGMECLLRAFLSIYRTNKEARLILSGGGSLAPELRKLIDENSIGDCVHCPGLVPNEKLAEYFSSADLYLSCSLSDGSSISLLEAMASGLPVVISDLPGNREWVEEGKNGFFGVTENPETYAEAIRKITAMDKNALEKMKLENRKTVEKRADWNNNFKQLLNAYQEVMKKERKAEHK